MEKENMLSIEVCFITLPQQFLRALKVPEGTTLEQAVLLSGVKETFPDIDFTQLKMGIYSKIKPPDTVLRELDRVEIYRALEVDPMVARRRRVQKKTK